MNIVVLYTRLPGYFFSCLKHLVSRFPDARVKCIVYKPAEEAPFSHVLPRNIDVLNKEEIKDLASFVKEAEPDILYVTGWGDLDYRSIAAKFVRRIPVILGLDNPWKGNLRQKLGAAYGKLTLQRYYNRIWVPGLRQYEFARRLGFAPTQIMEGLYCADTSSLNRIPHGQKSMKTILFTGRMVDYKHPDWLVSVFCDLLSEGKFLDWQLVMLGSGPLTESMKQTAAPFGQVKFVEFVQPEVIAEWYRQASIFCLPSTNEHWGVVVQEAAAAALPLLLSDSCGAGDSFLINGANGYLFKSGSREDLKRRLTQMLTLDQDRLQQMGGLSRLLSSRFTVDTWVDTFMSVKT